jgi:hypothetical protein
VPAFGREQERDDRATEPSTVLSLRETGSELTPALLRLMRQPISRSGHVLSINVTVWSGRTGPDEGAQYAVVSLRLKLGQQRVLSTACFRRLR